MRTTEDIDAERVACPRCGARAFIDRCFTASGHYATRSHQARIDRAQIPRPKAVEAAP